MILCMNASGRLVHHAVISEGTVDAACVYPREVIRTAIEADAVSIILVHNHPSGALKPSEQDIRSPGSSLTLPAHGHPLNDHFVVSRHGLYSITLGREI
jgi:DNA repair protein RadC